MSGGSYNYLYHADSSDIGNKIDDLKDMINRLSELGFEQACKDSQNILDTVKQLDSMIDNISNVWKSVEYMDSGDWGIEEVKDEIEKYNVKTNEMKRFLIQYETGKNDMAGMQLHVLKKSQVVLCESIDEAIELSKEDCDLRHYGHRPDYQKVTDIKELI